MSTPNWISFKDALAAIPSGERYADVIRHGTMHAGLYAPHQSDDQEPHDQDELYVVFRGSGFFRVEDERRPFGPGDLLFVEAGREHAFESFTPDFAVWAIFWGPDGGQPTAD